MKIFLHTFSRLQVISLNIDEGIFRKIVKRDKRQLFQNFPLFFYLMIIPVNSSEKLFLKFSNKKEIRFKKQ